MSELDQQTLLAALVDSQQRLSTTLKALAAPSSWRPAPGEWAPHEIAAHLATAEKECFLERVQRLATEEHPVFEYYDNTGRDFSQADLPRTLANWAATRQEILAYVRQLPAEVWARTGLHATFGSLDLAGVIQVILDHDREHLEALHTALQASDDSPG